MNCKEKIEKLNEFIDDEIKAVEDYGRLAEQAEDPVERLFWLGVQADERKHMRAFVTLREELKQRCEK